MATWLKQEIETLKRLRKEGKTYNEIANILNRTYKSIEGKCLREKIPNINRKEWTKEEVELLRLEITNGKNYSEIGKVLDRSTISIKQKCFTLKLDYPAAKHWSAEDELRLKYLVEIEKLKYIEISEILNRSPSTLKTKVCELQLNYFHSGSFDVNVSAHVYLIYFPTIGIYKIGVSNNYMDRINNFGYIAEVLLVLFFKDGKEALEKEKELLKNIKKYKTNTGLLYSGNTETFKYTE